MCQIGILFQTLSQKQSGHVYWSWCAMSLVQELLMHVFHIILSLFPVISLLSFSWQKKAENSDSHSAVCRAGFYIQLRWLIGLALWKSWRMVTFQNHLSRPSMLNKYSKCNLFDSFNIFWIMFHLQFLQPQNDPLKLSISEKKKDGFFFGHITPPEICNTCEEVHKKIK